MLLTHQWNGHLGHGPTDADILSRLGGSLKSEVCCICYHQLSNSALRPVVEIQYDHRSENSRKSIDVTYEGGRSVTFIHKSSEYVKFQDYM